MKRYRNALLGLGLGLLLFNTGLTAQTCQVDFQMIQECDTAWFKASSNGNYSYTWAFGNHAASTGDSAWWLPPTKGTYKINLRAHDSSGAVQCFIEKNIYIGCNSLPDSCVINYSINSSSCNSFSFAADTSLDSSSSLNKVRWFFGDGVTDSGMQVTHSYQYDGRYLSKMQVDGFCDGEQYQFVDVQCSMVDCNADFDYTKQNCATFSFTDQSTNAVLQQTVAWHWDFGDGATSSSQHPVYQYSTPGLYPVSLTVTSSDSCKSVYTDTIRADCPHFTCNSSFQLLNDSCNQVLLIDNSYPGPSDSILYWFVKWGDGTDNFYNTIPDTVSHTYIHNGFYQIDLVVTTHGGCSKTSTQYRLIECPNMPPNAAFSYAEDRYCNELKFFDESSTGTNDSVISYLWDFGDGHSSTSANPSHVFQQQSNLVTLIVYTAQGYTDTTQQMVNIECIQDGCSVDFTADSWNCDTTQFYAEPSILFGDLVIAYHWDFGDGNTSAQANPRHKYQIMGTYYVQLSITTADSCTASIARMQAYNCIGTDCRSYYRKEQLSCDTYQFWDSSMVVTPSKTATSWTWDFGNGQTSTQQNPVHTYPSNGQFYANLTVTYDDGCVANYCEAVLVECEGPCAADFAYHHDCSGTGFLDSSRADTTIVSWNWDFGDGNSSTQRYPFHQYSNAGAYDVTLQIITSSACTSSVTKQVIADCDTLPDPSCNADFRYANTSYRATQFYDESNNSSYSPIISWSWDFGDGNTSSDQHPFHQYAADGTYQVSLTVITSRNCTASTTGTVIINNTQPTCSNFISLAEQNCGSYSYAASYASNAGPVVEYKWSFGDGDSAYGRMQFHSYEQTGFYQVCLQTTTADSCISVSCSTIYVGCVQTTQCNSNFSFNNQNCPSVSFADSSTADTTIISWNWDFGDGNSSFLQNPTHQYAANGNYYVCLETMTIDSCVDQTCKIVPINCFSGPSCRASFSFSYQSCDSLWFYNHSSSGDTIISYYWDFGDGNQAYTANPAHKYNVNGSYQVCLSITTSDSCTSFFCDTVTVSCNTTFCDAYFEHQEDSCNTIQFWESSTNISDSVIAQTFYFGDGNSSTLWNPRYTYAHSGYYQVCVDILTADSCRAVYCDTIYVGCDTSACNAKFSVGKGNNCDVFLTDLSTTQANNIVSWTWTMGDGTTYGNQQGIHHTYNQSGTYTACLTTIDSDSCVSQYCETITVNCGSSNCFAGFQYFTNNGSSFSFVDHSSQNATSWTWDFGDGNISTQQNPSHFYTQGGNYAVCLSIVTADSCYASFCDTITVSNPNSCRANFGYSFAGCDSVAFWDNSTPSVNAQIVSYSWDFGNGTYSSQSHPTAVYSSNGSYQVSLTITDSDSCVSTHLDTVYINCQTGSTCKSDFVYTHSPFACDSVYFYEMASNHTTSTIVDYHWDFGDGTWSSSAYPLHQYPGTGIFVVSLTILTADSCLDTYSDTVTINCNVPVTCNANYQYHSNNSKDFNFFDASSASPGNIISWNWNFGDGNTSNAQNPSHSYTQSGNYVVCLDIMTTDSCYASFCDSITAIVNPSFCKADFGYSDSCRSVWFIDSSSSSSPIVSWNWDLGDGTQSTNQYVHHTYNADGLYVVCLTIQTADSCISSFCDTIAINCNTSSCTADFNYNNQGCSFNFYDNSFSSDSIVQWNWDFGDGNSASGTNVSHSYNTGNSYVWVCLNITTASGCIDSYCDSVYVPACLGIEETGPSVSIFPNPSSDFITVQLNAPGLAELKIFNSIGELVHFSPLNAGKEEQVDLSGLADGLYFVEIYQEKAYIREQLIIQR